MRRLLGLERGSMKTEMRTNGATSCILVRSEEVIIKDGQSALDFFMSTRYESGVSRIAINKSAIVEEFFVLSNGILGEILQKAVNYRIKLAIYGNYSHYTSKPLKDFIYESNKGSHVFFAGNEEEAVDKLLGAKE